MNDAPSALPAGTDTVRDLTPFEKLMLIEERPGFPMCFFLECRVTGPLDEDRLRRAVAAAAERHPLLCSRVARRPVRPRWLPPDVRPTVIWRPVAGDPWTPIDLARESGVRLVVLADGPDRHSVVMQVHHSACDGIAACEYFGDVWAVYAGLEPRPFAPGRSGGAAPGPAAPRLAPGSGTSPLDFARFLPTPLTRLAAPRVDAATIAPPYASLQFDAPFTARLRAAADRHGTSLNDVLVAAVMRAVGGTTYANALALGCLCSATPDAHAGAAKFLESIRDELEAFAGGR